MDAAFGHGNWAFGLLNYPSGHYLKLSTKYVYIETHHIAPPPLNFAISEFETWIRDYGLKVFLNYNLPTQMYIFGLTINALPIPVPLSASNAAHPIVTIPEKGFASAQINGRAIFPYTQDDIFISSTGPEVLLTEVTMGYGRLILSSLTVDVPDRPRIHLYLPRKFSLSFFGITPLQPEILFTSPNPPMQKRITTERTSRPLIMPSELELGTLFPSKQGLSGSKEFLLLSPRVPCSMSTSKLTTLLC